MGENIGNIGYATIGINPDLTNIKTLPQQIDRILAGKGINLSLNDKAFRGALGRISSDVNEFTKSLNAANARVIAFGASTVILYKIQDAFKELIGTAIDVEKRINDINTIFQLSNSGLKKFSGDIFNIAKQTAQSYSTVTDAAKEYSRQGLSVEETIRRTRDAMILARQSNLDAADSVQNLTAIMNVYGDEIKNTTNVVNKLSNVDAGFAVSVSDLTEAFSRAGSSAKEAGVNFNQFAALVTVAQQNTARGGAVIGNAFKTIFARIQTQDVQNKMQQLGANFQDINGKTLEGVRLLQEYANRYKELKSQGNLTGANELTQAIGGTRQMNILLSTMKGFGTGDYEKVLSVAEEVSNRAIERNAQMNKSIADTYAQTKADLAEISNLIAKNGLNQSIKSYLDSFRGFADFAKNALDGEETGSKFAQGLVNGINKVLSGPGLAAVLGIALGLIIKSSMFIKDAFRDLMGLNNKLNEQKAVQQFINSLLAQNSEIYSRINSSVLSQVEKEQLITNELRKQIAIRERAATITSDLSMAVMGSGIRFAKTKNNPMGELVYRGKNFAEGYLPIDREQNAINNGVGGARSTDKPLVVTDFNFGNGKTGMVVANSGEKIIRGAGKNGADLVLNRNMMNNGFIPNFADPPSELTPKEILQNPSKLENAIKKYLTSLSNQRLGVMGGERERSSNIISLRKLFYGSAYNREDKFDNEYVNKALLTARSETFGQTFIKNTEKNLKAGQSLTESIINASNGFKEIGATEAQMTKILDGSINHLLQYETKIKEAAEKANLLVKKQESALLVRQGRYNLENGIGLTGELYNASYGANKDNILKKYFGGLTLAEVRKNPKLYSDYRRRMGEVRESLVSPLATITSTEKNIGTNLENLSTAQILALYNKERNKQGGLTNLSEENRLTATNFLRQQYNIPLYGNLTSTRTNRVFNLARSITIEERFEKEMKEAILHGKDLNMAVANFESGFKGMPKDIKLVDLAIQNTSKSLLAYQTSIKQSAIQIRENTFMKNLMMRAASGEGSAIERKLDKKILENYLRRNMARERFGDIPLNRIDEASRADFERDYNIKLKEIYPDTISTAPVGKWQRRKDWMKNKLMRNGQLTSVASFGIPIGLSMLAGASETAGGSSALSGGLQGAATGAMFGSFFGLPGMAIGGIGGGLVGALTSLKSATEKQVDAINKQLDAMSKVQENYQSMINLTNNLSDAMENNDRLAQNRIRDELQNKLLTLPSSTGQEARRKRDLIQLLGSGNLDAFSIALGQDLNLQNKKILSTSNRGSIANFLSKNSHWYSSSPLNDKNIEELDNAVNSFYSGMINSEGFARNSAEYKATQKFKGLNFDQLIKQIEQYQKNYNTKFAISRGGPIAFSSMAPDVFANRNLLGLGTEDNPNFILPVLQKLKIVSETEKQFKSNWESQISSQREVQIRKNEIDKFLSQQNIEAYRQQSQNQIYQTQRGLQLSSLSGYISPLEETRQKYILQKQTLESSLAEKRRKTAIQIMGGSTSKEILDAVGIKTATKDELNQIDTWIKENFRNASTGNLNTNFLQNLQTFERRKHDVGPIAEMLKNANYTTGDINDVLAANNIKTHITSSVQEQINKISPLANGEVDYQKIAQILSLIIQKSADELIFQPSLNKQNELAAQSNIDDETARKIINLEEKNAMKQQEILKMEEDAFRNFNAKIEKLDLQEFIRSSRVETFGNALQSGFNFNSRYMSPQQLLNAQTSMIRFNTKADVLKMQNEYNQQVLNSVANNENIKFGQPQFLLQNSGTNNNINNLQNQINTELQNAINSRKKQILEAKTPQDITSALEQFRGNIATSRNNALKSYAWSYNLSSNDQQQLLDAWDTLLKKNNEITSSLERGNEKLEERKKTANELADISIKNLELEQKYNESIASGMASASAKLKALAENKAAVGESFINGLQGAGTGFFDRIVGGQNAGRAALQSMLDISESIRKPITDQLMANLVSGAQSKGFLNWFPKSFGQSPNAVQAPLGDLSSLGVANSSLSELAAAANSAAMALNQIGGGSVTTSTTGSGSGGFWSSLGNGIKSFFGFGSSSSTTKKYNGGIIGYANGGGVDTVPMWGTNGEFVINRNAARNIGYGNLNRLNHYASGGSVSFSGYSGDLLSDIQKQVKDKNTSNYNPNSNMLPGNMSMKFWHSNSPAAKQYWAYESELYNLYKKQIADRKARHQELRNLAISTAASIGMSYAGSGFNNWAENKFGGTQYQAQQSWNKMASSEQQKYNNFTDYYRNKYMPSLTIFKPGVRQAGGGNINYPQYGNGIDTVPSWLTNGEYVIRKSVVDRLGTQFFDNINNNKYASGGLVGTTTTSVSTSTSSSNIKFDLNINGNNAYSNSSTTQTPIDEKRLQSAIKVAITEEIAKQQRVSGSLRKAGR